MNKTFRKIIAYLVVMLFAGETVCPVSVGYAQILPAVPSVSIALSPAFIPPHLTGMTIHPDNPFQFDFIVDAGDDHLQGKELKTESMKLVKYFLASLTVPDKELWVNLAPGERERIVPPSLGQTDMGRDMLNQDFILKQLTSSLLMPENESGKKFWEEVYTKTQAKFETADLSTDILQRVWIVPEKASIYVHENNVFVVDAHLKVMMEEEYKSGAKKENLKQTTQIMKDIIIPAIEKEVNTSKNFAQLRQIYYSMILATWYKQNLKQSVLAQKFADQNKVQGIDQVDKNTSEQIYEQYLQAFKKGAQGILKEEYNSQTQEVVTRKYISGGNDFAMIATALKPAPTKALGEYARNQSRRPQLRMVVNVGGRSSSGVIKTSKSKKVLTKTQKTLKMFGKGRLKGKNISQAARLIGISPQYLALHFKNHPEELITYGIVPGRNESKSIIIPGLLKKFGKKRLKGKSIVEAATIIGVSSSGLSNHLRNYPESFQRYGIKRPATPIFKLLKQAGKRKLKGRNVRQAAKIIGVTSTGLLWYLRHHPEYVKKYGLVFGYQSNISESLKKLGKSKLRGKLISEVARLIGVTGSGLSWYLIRHPEDFEKYGIKKPTHIPKLLKQFGKEKLQGKSIRQVARIIGASPPGLFGHLRYHPEDFENYGIVRGIRGKVRLKTEYQDIIEGMMQTYGLTNKPFGAVEPRLTEDRVETQRMLNRMKRVIEEYDTQKTEDLFCVLIELYQIEQDGEQITNDILDELVAEYDLDSVEQIRGLFRYLNSDRERSAGITIDAIFSDQVLMRIINGNGNHGAQVGLNQGVSMDAAMGGGYENKVDAKPLLLVDRDDVLNMLGEVWDDIKQAVQGNEALETAYQDMRSKVYMQTEDKIRPVDQEEIERSRQNNNLRISVNSWGNRGEFEIGYKEMRIMRAVIFDSGNGLAELALIWLHPSIRKKLLGSKIILKRLQYLKQKGFEKVLIIPDDDAFDYWAQFGVGDYLPTEYNIGDLLEKFEKFIAQRDGSAAMLSNAAAILPAEEETTENEDEGRLINRFLSSAQSENDFSLYYEKRLTSKFKIWSHVWRGPDGFLRIHLHDNQFRYAFRIINLTPDQSRYPRDWRPPEPYLIS